MWFSSYVPGAARLFAGRCAVIQVLEVCVLDPVLWETWGNGSRGTSVRTRSRGLRGLALPEALTPPGRLEERLPEEPLTRARGTSHGRTGMVQKRLALRSLQRVALLWPPASGHAFLTACACATHARTHARITDSCAEARPGRAAPFPLELGLAGSCRSRAWNRKGLTSPRRPTALRLGLDASWRLSGARLDLTLHLLCRHRQWPLSPGHCFPRGGEPRKLASAHAHWG